MDFTSNNIEEGIRRVRPADTKLGPEEIHPPNSERLEEALKTSTKAGIG